MKKIFILFIIISLFIINTAGVFAADFDIAIPVSVNANGVAMTAAKPSSAAIGGERRHETCFHGDKTCYNEEEKPFPESRAYILIEAETGEILYAKNEKERLPISSLAQIMTLLLLTEELNAGNVTLDDEVPAPAEVMGLRAPVIWLNAGEVMPLRELAKAVVISSANDAALSAAVYTEGGAEAFAARMNSRASELGMNDTFFSDPGDFERGSYSTAYDVAIMTAELFKSENRTVLNEFYTTRLSAVREGTEREAQLVNTNKIARWYDGILGGKAGHSPEAGFGAANCAQKGGLRLVSVVLGAENDDSRFEICERLFDDGFGNFEFVSPEPDVSLYSPVRVMRGVEKSVPAVTREPVRFIAPRGYGGQAEFEYAVEEFVTAGVEKGQVLGNMRVRLGGKIVFESEIIALFAVEELTFGKSFELVAGGIFRL